MRILADNNDMVEFERGNAHRLPSPFFSHDDSAMDGMTDAPTQTPLAVLRRVFGYSSFRGQQQEIVEHVVAGGDAIVLMPTGGGKSLCYQLPALLRPGMGGVVSPLISLMKDQAEKLEEAGVAAEQLNSAQKVSEQDASMERIAGAESDIVFATPERLADPGCGTGSLYRDAPVLRRDVEQIDLHPDLEPVEPGREQRCDPHVGVEPELLGADLQHSKVGRQLSLRLEQQRVGSVAVAEHREILREQAVEERAGIASHDPHCALHTAIDDCGAGAQ